MPSAADGPTAGAVTAVVVDWNLPDQTSRCVRALVDDGVPATRVVVVENGPTETTWTAVTRELSSSVLVRVEPNVGFARANNIGAKALPGRAYLLVNNDAFVHAAGSVGAMLAALERPGVGIVVPRLLNADLTLQPTVAPFTRPLTALVRASGLSRFLPDRWQPRLSTHWSHSSSREIEAAIGAVTLVEAAVWEQLEGLRETSFMYAEDLDLCWRAAEQGWKTWFCAEAEFVHLGGASSGRRWGGRERAAHVARAEAEMIREHLSPAQATIAIVLMRLGLAVRAVAFGALGNEAAAERCRGSLEGLARRRSPPADALPPPSVEVVRPG